MYKPIRDYAIIGNLRSAALVSKDGSIDWLPAPFIDSPSIFASILDDKKGGFWSINPRGKFSSTQKYINHTNILVTKFKTKGGIAELLDFIPIEPEKERKILPKEEKAILEIHRKIICKKGICKFKIIFDPKFNYASGNTIISTIKGGISIRNNKKKGILISSAGYEIKNGKAIANIYLSKGETRCLTLRYNTGKGIINEVKHYEDELRRTRKFWDGWVHRCDLKTCPISGPWHDQAIRSSLVLKILFFEPVGTIAAAATTSLPEEIGGVRNWDYRFAWIRDSYYTLQALFRLGYVQEAEKFIKWVISECSGISKKSPEYLQIMYGLRGEHNLKEKLLSHLEGYKKSRPVRVGNGAYQQKQWDIYGSILDIIWKLHLLKGGKAINNSTWRVIRVIADYVAKIWREPDEGLWEVRGGKKHFVYSKVMCWVALDRAIKIAGAYGFKGDTKLWKREMGVIYKEIMEKGWDKKKKSFTQNFGSNLLDASALKMSAVGFIPGKDPKMISTIKQIEKELSVGEGLLLRYKLEDGLPGKEGIFLLASFWLIDALILAGQRKKAMRIFVKMQKLCNHVGLYSEEMDFRTKEFLGNFPQAYTHIGFINSAMNLSKRK